MLLWYFYIKQDSNFRGEYLPLWLLSLWRFGDFKTGFFAGTMNGWFFIFITTSLWRCWWFFLWQLRRKFIRSDRTAGEKFPLFKTALPCCYFSVKELRVLAICGKFLWYRKKNKLISAIIKIQLVPNQRGQLPKVRFPQWIKKAEARRRKSKSRSLKEGRRQKRNKKSWL